MKDLKEEQNVNSKQIMILCMFCFISNLHSVPLICNCVFQILDQLCMTVTMIAAERCCSFQVFLRSGLAVMCLSRKPLPQKASARDPYIKDNLHTSLI